MAYGFDRFLTTHTGSLPRPEELIRAMFAKEEGVPVDRAALAATWIIEVIAGIGRAPNRQARASTGPSRDAVGYVFGHIGEAKPGHRCIQHLEGAVAVVGFVGRCIHWYHWK